MLPCLLLERQRHRTPPPSIMARNPRISRRSCVRSSTPPRALNSRALEDEFIKLYFSHAGHPQSFWQDLGNHADLKPHVERLQLALQVDLLTSGHVPLIAALMKRPGMKSMRDLAHLDDAAWHALIAQSGVPHQIPGSSPEARAQFYAGSITATLDAAFPTVTAWRIAVGSHHVDPLAARFLENSLDFDIRTTRIDAYADHHAATAFRGIAEPKRPLVIKDVKRLQRLFAVSTSSATFRARRYRFRFRHGIAVVPRAVFASHYGHIFGGTGQATEVHERASS